MPYKHLEDKRRNDKEYAERRKEAAGASAPFIAPICELKLRMPKHGLRIAVIPDTQVRPGVPLQHLTWCGKYLALKKPDVIVQIGDFNDMSSLSTHEQRGSIRMEGLRYKRDVECSHKAQELLLNPIRAVADYDPHLLMTLGNHDDRITRTVQNDPKLQGLIDIGDLGYSFYGWTTYPFLQPVSVGGVAFCHYFPSGVM